MLELAGIGLSLLKYQVVARNENRGLGDFIFGLDVSLIQ
jgi:hypothetical protein